MVMFPTKMNGEMDLCSRTVTSLHHSSSSLHVYVHFVLSVLIAE
jgi:hypothetical protein